MKDRPDDRLTVTEYNGTSDNWVGLDCLSGNTGLEIRLTVEQAVALHEQLGRRVIECFTPQPEDMVNPFPPFFGYVRTVAKVNRA
jgi:hypothetical protein